MKDTTILKHVFEFLSSQLQKMMVLSCRQLQNVVHSCKKSGLLVANKFNCGAGCFTKFVRPQCIRRHIGTVSGCIWMYFLVLFLLGSGNPSCPGEAMDLLTSMARILCGFMTCRLSSTGEVSNTMGLQH